MNDPTGEATPAADAAAAVTPPVADAAAPVAPAAEPVPASPLAAAREAAGLSLADAARQLKLSPWQVEALEAGDYARLPGPVFVRGFLRNYARLLHLDPAPLLAGVVSTVAAIDSPVTEPAPPADIPFPGQRQLNWKPYAIGGALIVAALGIYSLFDDEPAAPAGDTHVIELPAPQVVGDEKAAPPADPVPAPAVEVTPAPAKAPAPTPVAPRTEVAPPTPAAKPPVVEAAKAVPAAAPAPAPAVEARPVRAVTGDSRVLRFMFERESWVEVRDGQGRVVFSQLNAAGSSQSVSGPPPLRLVIGNASGVRILYNDRAVDLAPHTQVDVARLTLE